MRLTPVSRRPWVIQTDGVMARLLFTLTEAAFCGEALIGIALLLAGMGDPATRDRRPAYLQLLPLSGFIVLGASIVGIQGVRAAGKSPRGSLIRVLVAAALIALMALWVGAAGTSGSATFATVMLIGIVAPVFAALELVRRSAASSRK